MNIIYKKTAEKIKYGTNIAAALILICALCMSLFSMTSCNAEKSTGIISSVKPKEYIGTSISTNPTLIIKSSVSDEKAVEHALSVSPKSDFKITRTGTDYALKFNSTLAANTVYTISSLLGRREVYQWAFQTVNDFGITSVTMPKNQSDKTIKITFSSDKVCDPSEKISITPKVDGKFTQNGAVWLFTANDEFLPQTEYTVTLKKDIATTDGQTLQEDMTYTFTTPMPKGKFVSLEKNGYDYAYTYSADETPTVLINSRGILDKSVEATVYSFADYSSYMQAHKTYFQAPDLSQIDTLVSVMTKVADFETSLDDYPQSPKLASDTTVNRNILVYPTVYKAGYYLCEITVGGSKLYHVFQISGLSVCTFTGSNNVTVWVNSIKTGKPLTDTEILLDSTYDEKTNENGVAVFNTADNEVISRYLLINDPNNGNVPFISYICTKCDDNNAASGISGVLNTDKKTYSPNADVKLFGTIYSSSADGKTTFGGNKINTAYIAYQEYTTTVSPDENGSFTADISLGGNFDKELEISLYVNDTKICSTTINISTSQSTAKYTPKNVSDVFVQAEYDGNAIILYSNKVSSNLNTSAKGASLGYCEKASVDKKVPMYYTGAYDLDYNVTVIRRSLFEKAENGKYYDSSTGELQTRYTYKRSIKDETAAEITGKTVNGMAKNLLTLSNDAQNGVYYIFKVKYKNAAGKEVTYTFTSGCDDNSYTLPDSSKYTINFSKTSSLHEGDVVSANVRQGDKSITSGNLLMITESGGIYGKNASAVSGATLTIPNYFTAKNTLYSAYFDGKNSYILNTATLSVDKTEKSLNVKSPSVTVTSDKTSYSKGDNVNLSIKSVDSEQKPIKATVFVSVYLQNEKGIITNSKYMSEKSGMSEYFQSSYTLSNNAYISATREDVSGYEIFADSDTSSSVYFGYVTTNANGMANISFNCGEYGSVYICTARLFYKPTAAINTYDTRADLLVKCDTKSLIDVSAKSKITINDEFTLNFTPNIPAPKAVQTTTADITNTTNTTNNTTQQAATTSNADDRSYYINTAIYNIPEKDIDKINSEYKFNDKAKLINSSLKAAYNEKGQTDFGKLAAGSYGYKADYEYNGQKGTLVGSFTVTAENTVTVPKIIKVDSTGSQISEISSNSLKAILYDECYSELFSTAAKLCNYSATDMSGELAYINSQKFFGASEINTMALKKYQSKSGLLLNKSNKEDLLLSACAVAVCSDYFDKDKLVNKFNEYFNAKDNTEKMQGLFGLCALREPMLDELNDYYSKKSELDYQKKLYLALSLAFIGDFDRANVMYNELSDKSDDIDSLNVALNCLLSCRLNGKDADSLLKKLSKDGKYGEYYQICYAEYINGYVFTSDEKDTATITIGDDVKNAEFEKSGFYMFDINAERINATSVSSNDNIYMCMIYTVSEKDAKKLASK